MALTTVIYAREKAYRVELACGTSKPEELPHTKKHTPTICKRVPSWVPNLRTALESKCRTRDEELAMRPTLPTV